MMLVRNKNTGEIYQVRGVSGDGHSKWIHRSYKTDRYLIWDKGYKWVDVEDFERVQS